MLTGKKIGFIGAGSMTRALLDGLVHGGLIPSDGITVTNRQSEDRLRSVRERWGVRVTRDRAALAAGSDILILSCKPADVAAALAQTAPHLRPGQLVISVAAGVPTAVIEGLVPAGTVVIRAMPNTSSRIRESVTAICAGSKAGADSLALAEAVFAAVGKVVVVEEGLMDVVTAVSGSGPAYVYYFIEALIEAGTSGGLPPEVARELVLQTVYGAARMLLETGAAPAELRREVTSPNGTTVAALAVLEERGVREALVAAVLRAAERARELAALAADAAAAGQGAPRAG